MFFVPFLYLISFFISLAILAGVIISSKRHNNMHYIFFCVLISISLFGYWTIAMAETAEEAMIGLQLTYVGRCFLELVAILILCTFCKIHPRAIWCAPVSVLCAFSMMSVMTIGKTDWFVRDLSFTRRNEMGELSFSTGPLELVFEFQLVFLFALFVMIFLYAHRHRTKMAYSNCFRIIGIMALGTVSFLFERFGNFAVEVHPFAFLIMEIVLITMVQTINMHDIDSNIVSHMLQQQDYGYIFIDMKRHYLGCNETAEDLLPQLRHLECEHIFTSKKAPVTGTINKWLNEFDSRTDAQKLTHRIYDDDKALSCMIRPLRYGHKNRQVGYTVVLFDDSQQFKYINLLNNYNFELEEKVKEKIDHIEELQNHVLMSMANIVENRDFTTGDHIKRTSHTVRLFMEYLKRMKPELQFSEQYFEAVWRAAPMHDMGKIAVRDYILNKPGKYTEDEYAEMKTHSAKGAKIVEEVFGEFEEPEFVEVAVNIAHYHHEKWDGSGYPEGLKGERIPMEARIMALADVFDALVSERCYKQAMSYEQAFSVIENSLGTHFDPVLGRYFVECKDDLIRLYEGECESAIEIA